MSNKIRSISALSIFLVGAAASFLPGTASAVPAFARQTSMTCSACHFQHFPTLNSFGRAFRAGGYTMTGGGAQIENSNMSLPQALPISVVAKVRYQKDNGDSNVDADHGKIVWPDEAALLIGGKWSKDSGYLMELGLLSDPENMFLSTKFHFNVAKIGNTQLSVIPFSTDGLGAAYGFELLNTGAQRSQRVIENRKGYSAANSLNLGSGAATGIALVASNNNFFVNYSLWGPAWFEHNTTIKPSGLTNYLRAAVTPTVGGWDLGAGVQLWFGDVTVADGAGGTVSLATDAYIIDGQAQGSVGGMPLGIYASYGKCNKDNSLGHFAGCDAADATASAILAELGVLPNKASIYAAFTRVDTGSAVNTTTFGINYMYAENIRFETYLVNDSVANANNKDQTFMFQMFAGF